MTHLLPGDTLVLCSDGLKYFVSEDQIIQKIGEGADKDAKALAKALTQKSADSQPRREGDSVTVIVVKVAEDDK